MGGMIPGPPTSEEDRIARQQGWGQFMEQLGMPGMNQTLFDLGTRLMQDRAPGQSNSDALGKALRGTLGQYNVLQQQHRTERMQDEEEKLKQDKFQLEKDQAATDKTYKEGLIENGKKRIAAYEAYVASYSKQVGTEGDIKRKDALAAAVQSVRSRFETMQKQLESMDPEDPAYGQVRQAMVDYANNMDEEIQKATQLFMGQAAAEPPRQVNVYTMDQKHAILKADKRYGKDKAYTKYADEWMQKNPLPAGAPTAKTPSGASLTVPEPTPKKPVSMIQRAFEAPGEMAGAVAGSVPTLDPNKRIVEGVMANDPMSKQLLLKMPPEDLLKLLETLNDEERAAVRAAMGIRVGE